MLPQTREKAIVEGPRQSVRVQNKSGGVNSSGPPGQLRPDAVFGQVARKQFLHFLRERKRFGKAFSRVTSRDGRTYSLRTKLYLWLTGTCGSGITRDYRSLLAGAGSRRISNLGTGSPGTLLGGMTWRGLGFDGVLRDWPKGA